MYVKAIGSIEQGYKTLTVCRLLKPLMNNWTLKISKRQQSWWTI